jgi:hypothetical protein
MLKQIAFAAFVVAMMPCVALAAQPGVAVNPPPVSSFSTNPEAPTSHGSAQLGRQSANQSLAQRLSHSNGTIQPPAVDRGMVKTPPSNGTMPVLKPPPNVQSK